MAILAPQVMHSCRALPVQELAVKSVPSVTHERSDSARSLVNAALTRTRRGGCKPPLCGSSNRARGLRTVRMILGPRTQQTGRKSRTSVAAYRRLLKSARLFEQRAGGFPVRPYPAVHMAPRIVDLARDRGGITTGSGDHRERHQSNAQWGRQVRHLRGESCLTALSPANRE